MGVCVAGLNVEICTGSDGTRWRCCQFLMAECTDTTLLGVQSVLDDCGHGGDSYVGAGGLCRKALGADSHLKGKKKTCFFAH